MWEEKLRTILLTVFFVSLTLPIAIQQTALGLSLAFLAYVCWRSKNLPSSPLDRPLLIFFGALLLSALLSPSVVSSLLGFRRLWLVGAFFVSYYFLHDQRETERLVSLLLFVAAGEAMYGIVQ